MFYALGVFSAGCTWDLVKFSLLYFVFVCLLRLVFTLRYVCMWTWTCTIRDQDQYEMEAWLELENLDVSHEPGCLAESIEEKLASSRRAHCD